MGSAAALVCGWARVGSGDLVQEIVTMAIGGNRAVMVIESASLSPLQPWDWRMEFWTSWNGQSIASGKNCMCLASATAKSECLEPDL